MTKNGPSPEHGKLDIARLTVVIDDDYDEAMYMDGNAVSLPGDTAYAEDIAEAAEGRFIDLTIKKIDFTHHAWPEKLCDALEEPAGDD